MKLSKNLIKILKKLLKMGKVIHISINDTVISKYKRNQRLKGKSFDHDIDSRSGKIIDFRKYLKGA